MYAGCITAGQILSPPLPPNGRLRLGPGLVLATLLFSADQRAQRVLLATTVWLGAGVLLFTIQ